MSDPGPVETAIRAEIEHHPHGAEISCVLLARHVDALYARIEQVAMGTTAGMLDALSRDPEVGDFVRKITGQDEPPK